ncbi:MAG: PTS sugar transporter subunit IIA [Pseudomonadota bacterium]
MIGFLVVTHGRLGAELINTAEFILGKIENSSSISLDGRGSPESMRAEIEKAVKTLDQGQGVVILTDMFGGTPSNISLSLLAEGKVEVLTGVNLPMIIKLAQGRDKQGISELAQQIGEYGRKSINVAGDLLSRRPRS